MDIVFEKFQYYSENRNNKYATCVYMFEGVEMVLQYDSFGWSSTMSLYCNTFGVTVYYGLDMKITKTGTITSNISFYVKQIKEHINHKLQKSKENIFNDIDRMLSNIFTVIN